MSRSALVALTIGAGIFSAGVAAVSIRPAPVQQAAAQESERPSSTRIELTRAQLLEAKAAGALDREVRSLIKVERRLRHGEFRWDAHDIPMGDVWVRIDLSSQIISVFRAGHEIGTAVILYGAENKQTPIGEFPVLAKREDHRSFTYDAPMPYSLWLTNDGVAIHGSDVRWGAATHGCVGVPLEFARLLFDQVRKGDPVTIIRTGSPDISRHSLGA